MSFHGGFFGSGVAIWIFSRRNGINPWSTADLCAAAVPIGIFFGRIANFINGELFGRPTAASWGIVFPEAKVHYPNVLFWCTKASGSCHWYVPRRLRTGAFSR
jgi:phosphatidylglycerol:prolipoprotein diacylglycerol transferase